MSPSRRNPFVSVLTGIILIGFWGGSGCSKKSTEPEPSKPTADYYAPKADEAPAIDGIADEDCWADAEWADMDYLWVVNTQNNPNGDPATAEDFSGRYKIVWTEEKLYFLIEITDDVLSDVYANPLQNYYMDDCLEIFIDEDHSGGDHQNNYNAFAYHIALDYHVVDIGLNGNAQLYDDHLNIMRTSAGDVHTWEVAVDVYTSVYNEILRTNSPKAVLKADKKMGYAVAMCDDDGQGIREHFYGSNDIPGADKNVAWQNASVFGDLLLVN